MLSLLLAAIELGDTIETRLVALAGAMMGVLIIFRIIVRYEKTFIVDQDREIQQLRIELSAAQRAIIEARLETEACHRERVQARLEIDQLRGEVAALRRRIDSQ